MANKEIKNTFLNVEPATNVRSTQGDRWLFTVSDEYLHEYDLKKFEATGKMGGNLRRKRQLEKYNAYKEELRYHVDKANFIMPLGFFVIWFYIPFPKSWRKKERVARAYTPHQNTPDLDNLLKAFFDSVMPRRNRISGEKGTDDRRIHNYAAFKVWVPEDRAGISIKEYSIVDWEDFFGPSNPQANATK